MKSLAGRTAILTGASRGIGVHIARALWAEDMNLVLAARTAGALDDLRMEFVARGRGGVFAVPTDVTIEDDLHRLLERARLEFGSVDVLVNNAGIENVYEYHKLSWPEIDAIIDVNLRSAMRLTWLALPDMLGRRCGHIVNVASLAGMAGPACAEPYAASKAGLIGFTQSLRASYRRQGVSASVVCPGFVAAGMYDKSRWEDTGTKPPSGVSTPAAVADAVVRAVKQDQGHVIVNPRQVRPLFAFYTLFPALAERLSSRFDSNSRFRDEAARREREAAGRP